MDDPRRDDLVSSYRDIKLIAKMFGEYWLDYSSKQPVGVAPYISPRITDWSYHEAELLFGHCKPSRSVTCWPLVTGLPLTPLFAPSRFVRASAAQHTACTAA